MILRMSRKKILAAILCISSVCLSLCCSVFSAVAAELALPLAITVHCDYGNENAVGLPFELYRVGDFSSAKTGFSLAGDFSELPVVLNPDDSETWLSTAETLMGYAQLYKIKPLCTELTDEYGRLTFSQELYPITPGLYLVFSPQTELGEYTYRTEPFLVSLPTLDAQTKEESNSVFVKAKGTRAITSEFANPCTIKVLKKWNDAGNEQLRPREIVVWLLRNGIEHDRAVLNKENNWRYSWEDLPEEFEWRAVEEPLTDYTVNVSKDGLTILVANTYAGETPPPGTPDSPPGEPELPRTGTLWYVVPSLAFFGLLFLVIGTAVRKKV